MNHFRIFLLSTTMTTLVACANESLYSPDFIVEVDRAEPIDTLLSEEIHFGLPTDTIDVFVCWESAFVGPYVVQLGTSYKYNIKICDLRNPNKVVYIGETGRAANEFVQMPMNINTEVTADSTMLFYCTDFGKNSVMCIDVEASYREEKCIVRKTYHFGERGGFQSFMPFYDSESENLVAGYQTWSYYDLRDNIFFPPKFFTNNQADEKIIEVYPKVIDNPRLVSIAYTSDVEISPNRSKIVEVLDFANILNILDIKSGSVLGVKEKGIPNELDFFEKNSSDEYYDKMKHYNGDIALTNDYFFRIWYAGCTNSEYETKMKNNGFLTLDILKYDGKYLGSCFMELTNNYIFYSDYYDCLFALGQNNTIYKYELPQWLKKN